jgi:hypothetical protein
MKRLYHSEVITTLKSTTTPAWQRTRLRAKIGLAQAAIHLARKPEGRLLIIAILASLLITILPTALTGSRIVGFDLARPGIVLAVAACAILAMPHRQRLRADHLRIANLYLLAAAASIPMLSNWLPTQPALAIPFLLIAASIIPVIALTAACLARAWAKTVINIG